MEKIENQDGYKTEVYFKSLKIINIFLNIWVKYMSKILFHRSGPVFNFWLLIHSAFHNDWIKFDYDSQIYV